jgi:hypothetical protein
VLRFGAVLEEFEVKDALSSILAKKGDMSTPPAASDSKFQPMDTAA